MSSSEQGKHGRGSDSPSGHEGHPSKRPALDLDASELREAVRTAIKTFDSSSKARAPGAIHPDESQETQHFASLLHDIYLSRIAILRTVSDSGDVLTLLPELLEVATRHRRFGHYKSKHTHADREMLKGPGKEDEVTAEVKMDDANVMKRALPVLEGKWKVAPTEFELIENKFGNMSLGKFATAYRLVKGNESDTGCDKLVHEVEAVLDQVKRMLDEPPVVEILQKTRKDVNVSHRSQAVSCIPKLFIWLARSAISH